MNESHHEVKPWSTNLRWCYFKTQSHSNYYTGDALFYRFVPRFAPTPPLWLLQALEGFSVEMAACMWKPGQAQQAPGWTSG